MRPPAGGAASRPIWRSSFAMVRTSMSCGTLARRSGWSVRSAAHMMGSAAFLAPEMRTSPSSGRPPRMRSLSTGPPLLGCERAHREGVNLLAHAFPERRVNQLVSLHAVAAAELGGNDQRLEVLSVADHLDMLAGKARFDPVLDAVRRDHQYLSLKPDFRIQSVAEHTAKREAKTIARLAVGAKSEAPKKP